MKMKIDKEMFPGGVRDIAAGKPAMFSGEFVIAALEARRAKLEALRIEDRYRDNFLRDLDTGEPLTTAEVYRRLGKPEPLIKARYSDEFPIFTPGWQERVNWLLPPGVQRRVPGFIADIEVGEAEREVLKAEHEELIRRARAAHPRGTDFRGEGTPKGGKYVGEVRFTEPRGCAYCALGIPDIHKAFCDARRARGR